MIKDNQILLLKRQNTGFGDGDYSVPAGHVDGGEKIAQAMIREANEEIGLNLNHLQLEMKHVMHRIISNDEERIDFFFTCQKWQDEPINNEPDKCHHIKWFDLDNLPQNIIPYVRLVINHVLAKQSFSEFDQ